MRTEKEIKEVRNLLAGEIARLEGQISGLSVKKPNGYRRTVDFLSSRWGETVQKVNVLEWVLEENEGARLNEDISALRSRHRIWSETELRETAAYVELKRQMGGWD